MDGAGWLDLSVVMTSCRKFKCSIDDIYGVICTLIAPDVYGKNRLCYFTIDELTHADAGISKITDIICNGPSDTIASSRENALALAAIYGVFTKCNIVHIYECLCRSLNPHTRLPGITMRKSCGVTVGRAPFMRVFVRYDP